MQDLSSAEWELLLLLLMCPETAEELEGMLVEEDRRELSRLHGSVRNGVAATLQNLRESNLVIEESEPNRPDADAGSQEVWLLTEQGRALAKHEAKKLNDWDESFRTELMKLGMAGDSATRAIGAVSHSGENDGDPQEAARRYVATFGDNYSERQPPTS